MRNKPTKAANIEETSLFKTPETIATFIFFFAIFGLPLCYIYNLPPLSDTGKKIAQEIMGDISNLTQSVFIVIGLIVGIMQKDLKTMLKSFFFLAVGGTIIASMIKLIS